MTKLTFYDLGLRRRLSLVTEKSNQFWHQLRSSSRSSHVRLDLSLLSLMLLFCLFSQAKFARISTLGEFLELRISISNVLLGVVCLMLWRLAIISSFRQLTWRSRLTNLLGQIVLRVTACTGVAGMIAGAKHLYLLTVLFEFWLGSLVLIS